MKKGGNALHSLCKAGPRILCTQDRFLLPWQANDVEYENKSKLESKMTSWRFRNFEFSAILHESGHFLSEFVCRLILFCLQYWFQCVIPKMPWRPLVLLNAYNLVILRISIHLWKSCARNRVWLLSFFRFVVNWISLSEIFVIWDYVNLTAKGFRC